MDDLKKEFDQQIRSLVPVSGLTTAHQNDLISLGKILKFKRRQHVFKQGDMDAYVYYLLEGELELEANGQLVKTVKGGTPDAKSALAQLKPRQLSAKAKDKVILFRAEQSLLDRLLTMDDSGAGGGEVEVSEVEADSDDGGDWMTRLLQSELFARIPPGNIQRLFAVMESVEASAGETVIEQGSVGEHYYVIQAGRCEVTRKAGSGGEPIRLAELGPGDTFGEEALIAGTKRNATITMLTDGELMRLTKDDFVELIKKPSLTAVNFVDAKDLIADGGRWLDVRMPDEHGANAIEGSFNAPLNSLRSEMKKLDEGSTYVVYCDNGVRSSAAAFLLAQGGFEVRYLKGGLASTPLAAEPDPAPTRSEPDAEPRPASPRAPAEKDKARPPATAKPPPASTPAPAERKEARPAAEKPAGASEQEAGTPMESLEADLRAASLSADVAKADTRMEEALSRKAEAEAAKRAAAKKVAAERAKSEAQAAKANAALDKAKRERLELERARREAETEAKRQREREEQRLQQLREKAEARLRDERAKLEAEYARQADELAKLRELKDKTKAEIEQEREALERKASIAKQQVDEAARARAETEDREKQLRADMEARIRAERRRLEEEFARATEEVSRAQREREIAEAVRQRAAEEAARIIAEQKAIQSAAQREEEAKLRAEREKLERDALKLRRSLDAARRAKREAESAKREAQAMQDEIVKRDMIAAAHRDAAPRRDKNLNALDAEVKRTSADLEAAEAAHRDAEEARKDLEDTQSWKKEEIMALRQQLQAELSEFQVENPTPKKDDTEVKTQAAREAAYRKRRREEEQKKADYNNGLVDDIAAQLDRD